MTTWDAIECPVCGCIWIKSSLMALVKHISRCGASGDA